MKLLDNIYYLLSFALNNETFVILDLIIHIVINISNLNTVHKSTFFPVTPLYHLFHNIIELFHKYLSKQFQRFIIQDIFEQLH